MKNGHGTAVTSTPDGEAGPKKPEPKLTLWNSEEIARRVCRGGAQSRVDREFYRRNAWGQGMRPDDYRDDLFLETNRARTAREWLLEWLLDEEGLARHAKWVTEKNPGAPAEALFAWLDQILYGTGVLALPRGSWPDVQWTADNMARSSFCTADWNAVAKEVADAEVEAQPLK